MHFEIADLLELAVSEPRRTLDEVDRLLADDRDPADRSVLHRAAGIAHRELRQVDRSRQALRDAVTAARTAGDGRLEGLALMTLAATESFAGGFALSLQMMDEAESRLTGDDLLVAASQRAGLLRRAGRGDDALAEYERALALVPSSGIAWIEGALRTNRGVLLADRGRLDEATSDTERALAVYERFGWAKAAADVMHNLAWLAGRRGDLVGALRLFDDAERRYVAIDVPVSSLYPDRCEVLLALGLHREALALASGSIEQRRADGDHADLAEALLLKARAALAGGDTDTARAAADEAAAAFTAMARRGWAAMATGLALDADLLAGAVDAGHVARAAASTAALRAAALDAAATTAALITADLAATIGDAAQATMQLKAVDQQLLDPAQRARMAEVQARLALVAGDPVAALSICDAALAETSRDMAALGGTELRRLVAQRVTGLAAIGLRVLRTDADGRRMLDWAERLRASSLAYPPIRPPDDPGFAAELDALRTALADLRAAEQDGVVPDELRHRCARLRRDVERHARLSAGGAAVDHRLDIDELLDAVGDERFVELIEVDERLLALDVSRGGIEVQELGARVDVERAAAFLRSALDRVLRRPDDAPARSLLEHAAAEVDACWHLDPAGGAITISPTAALHATPWGVLPSLKHRPVVVAPSAGIWLRARGHAATGTGGVFVAGPDLEHAGREVASLAADAAAAIVLEGGEACADRVLAAVAGRRLVHLACHGSFNAEHPMFSALRLADGPLFLHDLERVERAPALVVLSACHAGLAAAHPGDELVGFASSLLSGGVANVVAAAVAIPDRVQLLDVMVAFHDAVRAGVRPSAALLAARRVDPVVGGAFVCVGCG